MSHVFTLHVPNPRAKGWAAIPERLLEGWMSQGFELVAMRDQFVIYR